MFGCILGPWFLDSPKRPIVHKHVSLLITLDGIEFIPMAIITPTIYLRNWALVTSIIVVRFMVDQKPFFLETLMQVDNNNFLFHQHLKAACDLLLLLTNVYFFPFEQLI
jgi:hypothetical protein